MFIFDVINKLWANLSQNKRENQMEFLDYNISKNVDKTNPIEYFKKGVIEYKISELRDRLFTENPIMALGVDQNLLKEKAEEYWTLYYDNLKKMEIPESFINILKNKELSKKQQISVLKAQSLSPMELQSLIIKAWNDFNYSYGYYHFDVLNIKKEKYKLPKIFNYSNNTVTKIGVTNLSDAELKQIINQRNARVINFIDNGESWHCFFMTYRSLSGNETWNSEKPHYHYISDKWNIKREDAIEQFKNGNYPSTNVHIICNV